MTDRERLASIFEYLDGTPGTFAMKFALANSNEERLAIVRSAVDYIAADHVQTRQLRQGRTEDELTIDVVSGLKYMGFNAWHDAQIGGHTDISVDGKGGFLWLCEAKIHKSYDWLLDGFIQLESYCPGIVGQNSADIMVFCYSPAANEIMSRWMTRLGEARKDVTVLNPGDDILLRFTEHQHLSTGLTLNFRHKIVPLYWEKIKDAKARRGVAA